MEATLILEILNGQGGWQQHKVTQAVMLSAT